MVKFKALIYFGAIMLLYFAIRYLRINIDHPSDFLRYHLTDLLFVPAMGFFALTFIRFIKQDHTLTISPLLIFIQVIFVSLYFEWYLPSYSPKRFEWYTSDLIDVGMYFLGGFLFLVIQRVSKSVQSKKVET